MPSLLAHAYVVVLLFLAVVRTSPGVQEVAPGRSWRFVLTQKMYSYPSYDLRFRTQRNVQGILSCIPLPYASPRLPGPGCMLSEAPGP